MPEGIVASGWADKPGTIDDLIVDAHDRGFPATARFVYDWVGLGLLDHPQRRTRGPGLGSDKALWPWTQRNLFRLLIDKRPQLKSISALCNVPVGIWLWWGESYVPTRQVQRALSTWAGKAGNVSKQTARRRAREMTDFLDDLDASRYQRRVLIDALSSTARDKRVDKSLAEAVEQVFDPGSVGRTFGSSRMPLTTGHITGLIETRILGLERAQGPAPVEELRRAWLLYRFGMKMYPADRQGLIETPLRPQDAAMWEEPTWEHFLNNACYHVSVILGGFVRHGT